MEIEVYEICGSRSATVRHYTDLKNAADSHSPTEIIHGGARGADALARTYAEEHQIPQCVVLPQWTTYGRAAGPRRNAEMVEKCDAVLALWDGESLGTANTINIAKKAGKPVRIIRL